MTANDEAQEFTGTGTEPRAGIGSLSRSADIMAAEVSRLLARPGFLGQSVADLRRADSAFDALDGLMRGGAPLPLHWPRSGDANLREPVTALYDSVSESLRVMGGAAQSFVALRSACELLHKLDAELRAGAPLPEPWQRQR
ncbi:gluzincin family metallopeptidase [Nocardiopsis ganjiahuensis]|uniref:hypothetical protein n=1 Tax=Nocardiopsis ganjiahuensis TaxID=239984 RepID=UPI001EF9DEA6|nr:hypothetical protein [Nocardiopsis ganjiahuensis]